MTCWPFRPTSRLLRCLQYTTISRVIRRSSVCEVHRYTNAKKKAPLWKRRPAINDLIMR
jgi:hypothetical protein